MKAEDAETIYRELLKRSSAEGVAYLREQLAAHEAKGYALTPPGMSQDDAARAVAWRRK